MQLQTHSISRRSFLERVGIVSLTGLALPYSINSMPFALPVPSSDHDTLVYIFLRGGMDGLSAVVPHTEAGYYDRRPTINVPADAVLDLDGQFGLHPVMLPLLEIWQEGDLAIVHASGSPDPTRSHFDAQDYMERGAPGDKQIDTGWIGRHLDLLNTGNSSPFRAIGMGGILQTSLRGPAPALALAGIDEFSLRSREEETDSVMAAMESLYTPQNESDNESLPDAANQVFVAVEALEDANPSQHEPQHGAVYPEDDFGQSLRQVAQLIRSDIGLETACVDAGGWDTHENMGTHENGRMFDLLENLAGALSAFYTDLGDEMGHVCVVAMSEFGRRVAENGNRGTDHGHGNCMFLIGGGIRGGKVYGEWPGLEETQLDRGDLAITTDFRDVLAEIAARRLGNQTPEDLFPGYTPTFLELADPLQN